jgi:hypothetical protein
MKIDEYLLLSIMQVLNANLNMNLDLIVPRIG